MNRIKMFKIRSLFCLENLLAVASKLIFFFPFCLFFLFSFLYKLIERDETSENNTRKSNGVPELETPRRIFLELKHIPS